MSKTTIDFDLSIKPTYAGRMNPEALNHESNTTYASTAIASESPRLADL